MLFLSRWQKAAFAALIIIILAGLATLFYARGRLAALDDGAPFFIDAPPTLSDADANAPAFAATPPEQAQPAAAPAANHLPLPAAPAPADADDGRISLNAATAAQLEGLPGIGPTLAGRIIAYREQMLAETGRGFASKEELLAVPGIGPKTYANLKDKVRL